MFVLKLPQMFCRKSKNSIKVCKLTSFWLYEIRRYKSIRLYPCSNGCEMMYRRSKYNEVEMILSLVACWQKKGTEIPTYIHTWTVPCCYCYFTKYSAYPRGMRSGLLLFSFHFPNHVSGFPPLLSTFCIQVPKHIRQQSSTPLVPPFLHLLRKTPAPKLHILNNNFPLECVFPK